MTDDPQEGAGPRPLQTGGGHGGGNRLLLYDTDTGDRLLKLYGRRGGRLRELFKRASYRVFERKRGVTASQRCAVERECLALWRSHGLDVPALLDEPLPPGADPRAATWLEHCPGRLLSELLADASLPMRERCTWAERLGAEMAHRQALALQRAELGLVMEHASTKHVLVRGERLVHFDLESRYAPPTPILDALSQELSSVLYAFDRLTAPGSFEPLAEAFLRGYGRPAQLRRIATHGTWGGGLHLRIRRWADRRRHRHRALGPKIDRLRFVLDRLD